MVHIPSLRCAKINKVYLGTSLLLVTCNPFHWQIVTIIVQQITNPNCC